MAFQYSRRALKPALASWYKPSTSSKICTAEIAPARLVEHRTEGCLDPDGGAPVPLGQESRIAEITHNRKTIQTRGRPPAIGSKAPDFKLTPSDLTDVGLASFGARRKILNVVPSLDTGVCVTSVRRFDAEAADFLNVAVLTISNDLPFAQKRFCEAEGIRNIVTLSQVRSRDFGAAYGVEIADGTLAGLLSRAVVVLDEHNKVLYTEQVPEIEKEPSYERALAAALK